MYPSWSRLDLTWTQAIYHPIPYHKPSRPVEPQEHLHPSLHLPLGAAVSGAALDQNRTTPFNHPSPPLPSRLVPLVTPFGGLDLDQLVFHCRHNPHHSDRLHLCKSLQEVQAYSPSMEAEGPLCPRSDGTHKQGHPQFRRIYP